MRSGTLSDLATEASVLGFPTWMLNFDGQTDLVQVYSHGDLIREIHDDNFDGKPEKIEEFRHGKLAIVERDPQERGYIDIVEYYDDSGKLIRREVRQK